MKKNFRVKNEAGADFSQTELSVGLLDDLVVAEVDFAFEDEEAEDVIDEGLGASVIAGKIEGGGQEGTSDTEVRDFVEFSVEVKKRAGVLEAVSDHAELIGGVDVVEVEFH